MWKKQVVWIRVNAPGKYRKRTGIMLVGSGFAVTPRQFMGMKTYGVTHIDSGLLIINHHFVYQTSAKVFIKRLTKLLKDDRIRDIKSWIDKHPSEIKRWRKRIKNLIREA